MSACMSLKSIKGYLFLLTHLLFLRRYSQLCRELIEKPSKIGSFFVSVSKRFNELQILDIGLQIWFAFQHVAKLVEGRPTWRRKE